MDNVKQDNTTLVWMCLQNILTFKSLNDPSNSSVNFISKFGSSNLQLIKEDNIQVILILLQYFLVTDILIIVLQLPSKVNIEVFVLFHEMEASSVVQLVF